MKIGIDASLMVGEKAGMGWSTANLIEALGAGSSKIVLLGTDCPGHSQSL